MRHSYAAHLLESGKDITTVQRLLGHENKRSTMLYTYLIKQQVKWVAHKSGNHILNKEDFNFIQ
ncbi:hypothetical protein AHMF7605_06890 [Adhaeribacter arboris]|uniref:Tyr recombinase domain-containing protein n=1 Tax=Adhaeribacter arboris TaxID=2072846 RepID=A0A2T2YCN4_9BACT|nr:tyrosine-type recombinase/integrase [Adhaeribacter arboris]PSR53275.1 hypothetical protein AHMF7605_06890 [Adhaeribacter arboris]